MRFLTLTLLALSSLAHAGNSAVINLVASIPNTCSVQVLENISPMMLGEAVRTNSLQRFTVPVQLDCNANRSTLKARPYLLTNAKAPGYEIYYHLNSDQGAASGLGWVNTSFTSPVSIAEFNKPVSQQIYLWIEGFKENSGRAPPAGDYQGVIQLSIDAQ